MIDTTLVHSRIADRPLDFLEDVLSGEKIKRDGDNRWRVGKHGSLAISIKDGVLVWFSHEEGRGGDAISLIQYFDGGTALAALKSAAAWAGVGDDGVASEEWKASKRKKKKPKPDPAPERLNAEQLSEARGVCERLSGDLGLCERIAQVRGWKPETIRGAALDGVLGWSEGHTGEDGRQWHRGALVFVYETGLKHRWKRGDTRMIHWRCGGPRSLWRGQVLTPRTERVFVSEGETDALSLLDANAEAESTVAVVSLPNAGVVPWGLASQLAGRNVVLCLDDDKAGHLATKKIAAAIGDRVASLKAWGGIQ